MKYLAYVYKLTFLKTGQYYIGYRYANIRLQRIPKDDLLINYFTSSKHVKKMIKEHGVKNIQSEIIAESDNLEMIYWLEQEIIESNWKDPLLLNRKYVQRRGKISIFKHSRAGHKLTKETKLKMIESRILNGTLNTITPESIQKQKNTKLRRYGHFNFQTTDSIQKQKNTKLQRYGKLSNNTPESIKKMIDTQNRLGLVEKRIAAAHTPEANKKRAEHFRKTYQVIDPNNKQYIVNNLRKFCNKNNLSYGCMRQVAAGKQKFHKKGWTIKLFGN